MFALRSPYIPLPERKVFEKREAAHKPALGRVGGWTWRPRAVELTVRLTQVGFGNEEMKSLLK